MPRLVLVVLFVVSSALYSLSARGAAPDLSSLRLPAGYSIEVWADGIADARSLARSPSGTIFVGTRRGAGRVYAVIPQTDGTRQVKIIASSPNSPNGVALRKPELRASTARIMSGTVMSKPLSCGPAAAWLSCESCASCAS